MIGIKTVSELPDETIGYHLKQAYRSLAKTGIRLNDFHGADVLMTDNPEINYLCLVKSNVILFMIRMVILRGPGLAGGQQIMLIPNAKPEFIPLTQRFSIFAVFKLLLPRYHILVSAREQTPSGAKMYRGLLAVGMENYCFAYVYDKSVEPAKLTHINHYRALHCFGYKEDPKKLLVLSDKEIKPTNPSVKVEE
jgi:hypothetical protein